ncbi:hypothetical protein [Pseudomonas japonica]|uniref:Uncharacterized protein n=1 Tax=Pseudomonas japonica TaxID=256466 RepID=A0A239BW13_9PSED|nr:hypothetical protein [Pseudomonas japonica]SNS11832.1 hypothetical protein SAMN05444352_103218 [Pseudomonas japonica]
MFQLLLRLSIAVLLAVSCAPSWALSGPETAAQLNQRLAATPAQCVGGKPPYSCSGVLVLPMLDEHPQPFWQHGGEAQERGSERFYFLRKDGYAGVLPADVGFLLQDRFTATGQGKPYEVIADDSATSGEVLVGNWAEDAPDKLAVQALYYDSSATDALLRAQRGQLEYFKATDTWLPLVRLVRGEGDVAFGFSQQEQLYNGYQVAARLNARYADPATGCREGRAGYYCSGILLRTVGDGDFHAWNPSPNAIRIDGVSFSYFRGDDNADKLVYSKGYVIRELAAPAPTPFEPLCVYPVDGAIGNAPDRGACTLRDTCQALGVNTLADWTQRYAATPRDGCSLGLSADDLQLLLDIRSQTREIDPWTEVVMRPWPQNIGEQLPIEAIVYGHSSFYEGEGGDGGRHIQLDYLQQTGRYLPLLETNLGNGNLQPFSYNPDDQGLP